MSSFAKALSTDVRNLSHQNGFPADPNLSNCRESHLKHGDEEEHKGEGDDEDEEEDVDFNPFLKDSLALEASSSLSSEVEILVVDVADSDRKTGVGLATNLSSMLCDQVQDYAIGDSEHGEDIVMQTATSYGGAGAKESERTSPSQLKKRKTVLISQHENIMFNGKENGSSSGTDCVNDVMVGDITQCRKAVMDIDDGDAICKRTRARYSLASFTLDELETFLQETDDDDDLQNIDDEEEYRKFLAAVLQGGDGDSQIRQGNEHVDDEDEENDADFEIEIEEALESDLDENTRGDIDQKREATGRRPETRQNRRQKASVRQKKRILGQPRRPLRPLLPNAPVSSFPVLIPETAPHFLSLSGHEGFINGFSPHQLGQLHCLIHEHVQLLIQVFSLCVLEPSRQHIGSQSRELISEMLHKRDQVVSWRRAPYPWFCFCPPYIHPSVQHGLSRSLIGPFSSDSACSFNDHRDCSAGTSHRPHLDIISPSKERYGCASNGQEGCFQASDSALWVPFVNGPILSVLDVAPLNLAGKYMEDVSIVVLEYQRQYVEAAFDTRFQKEPLFPFHSSQSYAEASTEIRRETALPTAKVPSYSTGDQPPKKTLAAALVERTKKEPVALVPKEIANLAHRFLPLFNPVLFPRKPPPAPVVNRVLFTDAEDELLALGLMEYNTNWKAIQQRFLPCKSKHQIFVRQKNRSSSKAPENPIKAVRRMKSSPLTVEEIARIQEGLKVFKLDWMSVCKFVVPYRDPSLLPRQWRIATGTQKSYKSTADKKEKRRLYASNRRKCKIAALPTWQTSSEKEDCQTDKAGGENNIGDHYVGSEDEVYIHEAFLADWRPVSIPGGRNQPRDILLQGGSHVMEQRNNIGSGESLPQTGLEFPAASKYTQNLGIASHFTHSSNYTPAVDPNHPVSDMTLRPSKYQYCSRPYRSRRTNSAHLVKLAPDLPPVNLPPSVRIMSESAFKSYQCGAVEKMVSSLPHVANSGSSHPIKSTENKRTPLKNSHANQNRQRSFVLREKSVSEDNGESDLQMHPLLFQSSGNGHLPYHPLNCHDTTSSFDRFSSFQPRLNLSLLHNPHQANQAISYLNKSSKSKETTSSAGGIDFHPLLQKVGDVSCDPVMAHSIAKQSVNLEPLRDSGDLLQDVIDSETRVGSSLLANCSKSSSPTDKANDLDLDIHLSFSSRKEKAKGRGDVAENSRKIPNLSDLGSGNSVDDQSLPEIVMEQEELSDSEEEMGEHVEFECEEMDDSEGDEGTDAEQIMDIHNKAKKCN